jgi:hypothetical protein
MRAAEQATELAAMSTPEFAAMLAAIFAFACADDAVLDTAHHFKNLKHSTTSWSSLNKPPANGRRSPKDDHSKWST